MFYEVPQFIKEEVKLLGLINFTQLGILVVVILFLFFSFYSLNLFFAFILASFLLPLSLILAFGQVNGIPTYKIFSSVIRHFWLPKRYFWKKEVSVTKQPLTQIPRGKTIIAIKSLPKKQLDKEVLSQLSDILDQ